MIDLTLCANIDEAYQTFKNEHDCDFISYKPHKTELQTWLSYQEGITDVSWIDVSNINNFYALFRESSITNVIGLEKWDVSHVRNMDYMFTGCFHLQSISNVSNWDVRHVQSMVRMFDWCISLTEIKGFEYLDIYGNNDSMFHRCDMLKYGK